MGPRRLGLGQDEEPVVVPEEGVYARPPSDPATVPSDSGGGSDGSGVGDAIGRIFVGVGTGVANLIRGISVVPNIPVQGYPGTRGCAPSQCPAQSAAGITVCVPCPSGPTFATVTAQPWFQPVAVVGVLVLLAVALGGRRR